MKKTTDKSGFQKGAESSHSSEDKNVSVVSIGASAGGLEAFSELLKNLPIKTGMAFVFVHIWTPAPSNTTPVN